MLQTIHPTCGSRFRATGKRLLAGLGLLSLAAALGTAPSAKAADTDTLRVCSDPANMPFSNAGGEGFENKLAELVAGALHKRLAYTWAPQDDNFVHDTLKAGRCDVMIGAPTELKSVAATQPYYWSSYVLISRTDRHLDITSLKDHRLRPLKIAVPSVGGNRLFSPPAQVLSGLRLADHIVAYPIDAATGGVDPRAAIVDAVAQGKVDMAALWGPMAGYFVKRASVPLTMTPIGDTDEFSSRKEHLHLIALQFEIGMGVRKGDDALRDGLNRVIAEKRPEIRDVLEQFGVPMVEPAAIAEAAGPHGAD